MANTLQSSPIYINDFSAVVDLSSDRGYASGTRFFVKSIEWMTPTSTAHTALITDAASGNVIFSEQCTTANQSIIKYFDQWLDNIYIAINGVGSGKIAIVLG
jgi:hypothetical protein